MKHNGKLKELEELLYVLEEDEEELKNYANRKHRWEHVRVEWDYHVATLMHSDQFHVDYRMSKKAWNKLKIVLEPSIYRHTSKSRANEPVYTEIVMGIGMRYLAGGTISDQKSVFGVSRTEAHRCKQIFIDAVAQSTQLKIIMPTSPTDWRSINKDFSKHNHNNIFDGCVGAIDGFFQPTIKPSLNQIRNQTAYYSGHYESYGVNCQAMVQTDLTFSYFGVVAPGATNDIIAFTYTGSMKNSINNLPLGTYVVADAAYALSENVLIPYTGNERNDEYKDAFNHYLSQLRIRVEMAFGRLTSKFRILKRKLDSNMINN